jgi:hypothetical protein
MLSNHPKAFESRSDQGEADRISPTTTTVSAHDSYSISSLWSISHSQSSSTQPKERREEEEEGTESSRDYAAIYRLAIRPVEAEADLPFLSGVRLLVETSTELLASSILEEPFVLPLPKLFPSLP